MDLVTGVLDVRCEDISEVLREVYGPREVQVKGEDISEVLREVEVQGRGLTRG